MNSITKNSYYEESKIMYNYLLKLYPNLDEKIYQEVLNVPIEKINKKIRSPFRKDTHPSFQFRYVTMEDNFASIDDKPIIRDNTIATRIPILENVVDKLSDNLRLCKVSIISCPKAVP